MMTRLTMFVVAAMLAGSAAMGQAPYPTAAGQPAWDGYVAGQPALTIDRAAPPQGSLPGGAYMQTAPVTLSPQIVVDPHTGQAWPSYPGPGEAMPGMPGGTFPNGIAPGMAPGMAPAYPRQGPIIMPELAEDGPPSLLPPGTRSGVFQKVNFMATWIPQLENDSFGWTDLRTDVVFGLPFFTRETPIVITPAYEMHSLDRPVGVDLPPRLNDLSIDFHHFRRIGDQWIVDFAVVPGLFADDHSFDSDAAIRINGRALAIYESSPAWKWVAGVTYVNGGWNKVVPVAGIVYEPHDGLEYRLVFPNPKISWRVPGPGLLSSPVWGGGELWCYVEADFGNAIWAVEQSDGTPDTFAWRDYRLLAGLERKIIGGLSHRIEVGYVFNREFKLSSAPGDTSVDDSFLLWMGVTY